MQTPARHIDWMLQPRRFAPRLKVCSLQSILHSKRQKNVRRGHHLACHTALLTPEPSQQLRPAGSTAPAAPDWSHPLFQNAVDSVSLSRAEARSSSCSTTGPELEDTALLSQAAGNQRNSGSSPASSSTLRRTAQLQYEAEQQTAVGRDASASAATSIHVEKGTDSEGGARIFSNQAAGFSGRQSENTRSHGKLLPRGEEVQRRLLHRENSLFVKNAKSWRVLVDFYRQQPAENFNYINISATFARLWKVEDNATSEERAWLLDRLTGLAMDKLSTFDAQGICNTLHAFATLKHSPGPTVLPAILRRLLLLLRDCDAQHLSQSLWALQRLKFCPPEVQAALTAEVEAKQASFKATDVATATYALACLPTKPQPAVIAGLAQRAEAEVQDLTTQELSNLLWAWAKLSWSPPDALMEAMEEAMDRRMAQYTPAGITIALYALAVLRRRPRQRVLEGLTNQALFQRARFRPAEMARVVWSLGELGYGVNHDLLAAISAAVAKRRMALNAVDVTQLLQGYVALRYIPPRRTLDRLARHCNMLRPYMETHQQDIALAAFREIADARKDLPEDSCVPKLIKQWTYWKKRTQKLVQMQRRRGPMRRLTAKRRVDSKAT